MTPLFWGYLLIFFNINIDKFELLPNFLGHVFIFVGLAKLEGSHFKKAKPFAAFMVINSLLFALFNLFGTSFEGELYAIYMLFTLGIWSYISYHIILGIKELELVIGRALGFQKLFTIWKIQTILQVMMGLVVFTQNEILVFIASKFLILLGAMNVIFLIYLYKVKSVYERETLSDHINTDEDINPKHPLSKIKKILIAFSLVMTVLVVLWAKGVFYIIDIQTSPNGKIREIVYSQNVSDTFPKDSGITMRTEGRFKGISVYENATYLNMWWSPCSHYLVKSLLDEKHILILECFKTNSASNLSIYINMSMSSIEAFTNLMTDEKQWESLKFDFLKWNDEEGNMTVHFEFEDYTGKKQKGDLDFDWEKKKVTKIIFE